MKASKYHINNAGEAMPCTAKLRCRFGGESGVDNHFATAEEAQKVAQELLQKEFSQVSSARRAPSPQFVTTREKIKSDLIRYGAVIDESELPSVNNEDEMIQKWFDGDRSSLESFKQFAEASSIDSDTKKSVGNLVQQGISVRLSDSVLDVPHSKIDGMFEGSEIDVLDDLPDMGIDMVALRNGSLRAFE